MAWTLNTASDYLDLLLRLKNFAVDSCGWTVDAWDTAYGTGSIESKLIMHGPGGGTDEIYVGAITYRDVGLDYYNWTLQGFTGYSALNDFNDQAGANQASAVPGVKLWNTSIPYWFVGNGRRVMGVAKVAGTYHAFYIGWFLPYGLPTEYSYPLAVGGSYAGYLPGTYGKYNISGYTRNFPDAYSSFGNYSSMWVLNGSWLDYGGNDTRRTMWPYNNQVDGASRSTEGANAYYDQYNGFWFRLQKNFDDSYPMFPVTITQNTPNIAMLGELEGVFAVPGWGIAAEDVIEHGGDTYIVFPTSLSPSNWEYFAMKMA